MDNTNNEILYSSVEEQIEKLKQQNLIIEDEDFATQYLEIFGYFNLIKGYRSPYIFTDASGLHYRSGITFNQILSLYMFDKNLRNAVIASMLDLEEHIKASAADVVAQSFGTHQDDYLNIRNYRDKRRRNRKFSLRNTLITIQKALNSDKTPVSHYREVHGIIPPWILFKNLYFSTIINFINFFKPHEKEQMVYHLYDVDSTDLSVDNLKLIMMDTLFVCLDYRNLAAHGGRIYNYRSDCNVRLENFSTDVSEDTLPKGFNQLIYILSCLKYRKPLDDLSKALNYEVNRHCSAFPEDATYLGQILNIDIKSENVVWITGTSDKFHYTPYCSGIKHPLQISEQKAIANGYIPCKRCCKETD